MRHIHVLDPQLTNVGGHYFNHDSQLVREVQRRGIGVSLYGRKELQIKECSSVTVVPVFRHDIFREAATDPLVWPMENFHQVNADFLEDLNQLDQASFAQDHLVYFPNIVQNQLEAVAQWLKALPATRRPTVAFMFRWLNHAMDYVSNRKNREMVALYYRFAVRHLQQVHPRCLFCADTTELCNAYRNITSYAMAELPNPMDVSELISAIPPKHPSEAPLVVYQGHTSPLRGFHFLPEIIDRCSRLPQRPKFAIQIQDRTGASNMGMQPVLSALDKMKGPFVELIEGALPTQDYLNLLGRADIVLLPYTPSFYGMGSSGVFTEAGSVGKVVVACEGTVPIRQGRDYQLGVVAAAQWTPASLSDALATALQQLPRLTQMASQAAPRFRKENSAPAFWDKLLAACNGLPTSQAPS